MFEMCSDQVRSDVSTTPRYLTESTRCNGEFSWMYSEGGVMELIHLQDTNMWQHLSACSFRCLSDSMCTAIAIISA